MSKEWEVTEEEITKFIYTRPVSYGDATVNDLEVDTVGLCAMAQKKLWGYMLNNVPLNCKGDNTKLLELNRSFDFTVPVQPCTECGDKDCSHKGTYTPECPECKPKDNLHTKDCDCSKCKYRRLNKPKEPQVENPLNPHLKEQISCVLVNAFDCETDKAMEVAMNLIVIISR